MAHRAINGRLAFAISILVVAMYVVIGDCIG